MKEIYLDNAATTKPVDGVLEAITPYVTDLYYNPSSLYEGGRKVREMIEETRERIAKEINAEPEEIYFTSGAAEANNWAIQGFWNSLSASDLAYSRVFYSAIEHASIMELMERNVRSYCIDCEENGQINPRVLYEYLDHYNQADGLSLVSIAMANNEIGTIQDIRKLAEMAHEHHAIFHTDATQAFGKIPIDVKRLGIDMMSASAQKIGGLKGVGFLYVNSATVSIEPLIYGTQENGKRGGTENVVGIAAFNEALKHIDYVQESNEVSMYRDMMISLLKNMGWKLNGPMGTGRLSNNINMYYPGLDAQALAAMLSTKGIYVSTGSACNSSSDEVSHVLRAIGLSEADAESSIRITLPSDCGKEGGFSINDVNYVVNEIRTDLRMMGLV